METDRSSRIFIHIAPDQSRAPWENYPSYYEEINFLNKYGSGVFFEKYCSPDKERAFLLRAWERILEQHPVPEDVNPFEWQFVLEARFKSAGRQRIFGQMERSVSELGVGRMSMQPSYFYDLEPTETGFRVLPLNEEIFGDQSQGFIENDPLVGESLRTVYYGQLSQRVGEAMAQYSGYELYKEYNSDTDVLIFYRVIEEDAGKKIIEGKYLIFYQKLSPEERQYIYQWFGGNEILNPPKSAKELVLHPVAFTLPSGGIPDHAQRLNCDFQQHFGKWLYPPTDNEMYRIIQEIVGENIDYLYETLMAPVLDKDAYLNCVKAMALESMRRWAVRNRPEISPRRHLMDIIDGFFPMIFLHPSNGENLWLYGDPIQNIWFYGDACVAEVEVCSTCKSKKENGVCVKCKSKSENKSH
jgi:hypothetical protein